jgi:hypothetical protein
MIFVSSTVAFAGVPKWSNYAATKAYDLVLAEGLASELRKSSVSVLAVCPGPTRTEFWPDGAKPLLAMEPGAVVDIALKNLGKRTTVVAGGTNRLIAFSTRLLPRSWNTRIFGRVIGAMLKVVEVQTRPKKANTAASKPTHCAGAPNK